MPGALSGGSPSTVRVEGHAPSQSAAIPIHSRDNPLIKRIRSLQRSAVRNRERAFIVEGFRAVSDMLDAGITPETLVHSVSFDLHRLTPLPPGVATRAISDALFNELSGTTTPQGILAIVPMQTIAPGPAEPALYLVADAISDPGNLGALLRSCAAAGVTKMLLAPNTADPYNPKVVRSAMGAHFAVPIARFDPNAEVLPPATAVIVSDARSPVPYDEVDLTGPVAIVVGSESTGVSPALQHIATASVSIPMASNTESLNAAVAGSILLFEAVRQRRHGRPVSANLA